MLELQREPSVCQADGILSAPWNRGKGCGRLSMLCRGEVAKFLLWPQSASSAIAPEDLLGPWGYNY